MVMGAMPMGAMYCQYVTPRAQKRLDWKKVSHAQELLLANFRARLMAMGAMPMGFMYLRAQTRLDWKVLKVMHKSSFLLISDPD